jgi:hypothetical protein
MIEHTPTPWYAEDWTDDNGSELVTVAAHEPEVLGPGQSSIWPDGIRKIRIAETVDSPNPIADAAFIVKACNNHEALVQALKVLLEEAEGFNVSGVYFDEDCMGHKGPALARAALSRC